ncbi:hypothetical protein HDU87_006404 [Geranomyces variabilis]|uniref:CRAL-TRIO domain-containing protein n=1 Tax=Geranomyces variabilis TaxID=109894 RepID=A0AAD5TFG0_9FUNG|nr:hypothetical protein HDU87_006404 [Geranomyces variabilis]
MDLAAAVHEHERGVAALRASLTATVAALRKDMDFSRRELHHLAEILVDDALLFRFYKKHKYQHKAAEQALLDHIDWRLQNDLPNLSTYSLTPKARQLSQDGLFYFWKTDLEGRPFAVVNLKHLAKGTDLEDLRMLFVVQMEVARRLVQEMNEESAAAAARCANASANANANANLIVQISVICDLGGVGLGNVNYEMIPLFLDLFNKHFPQTLGTVYVLNYGWLHSGIWSIVKAALPADACRKLQFCNKQDLLAKFAAADLQDIHGGTDTGRFCFATSPIYTRFAHPNYHSTSRRVLAHISALDAEDEGYHEDEEVWYDAMETPMTPVRSAADLQSMLRVTSGRNLHGMNRVGSTKSLKSLSTARAGSPAILAGGASGPAVVAAAPLPNGNNGLMMRTLQAPPLPLTIIPPTPTTPLYATAMSSPSMLSPSAAAAAAAAGGLFGMALSTLGQQPLITNGNANTTTTTSSGVAATTRIPGRRRALVRKTLANAVCTPARPLLSLLSRISQHHDDEEEDLTSSSSSSAAVRKQQQRRTTTTTATRALAVLTVLAVALVYTGWKRRVLGRAYYAIWLMVGGSAAGGGNSGARGRVSPASSSSGAGLCVVSPSMQKGGRRRIPPPSVVSATPTTVGVARSCASEFGSPSSSSSSSSWRTGGGLLARLVAASSASGVFRPTSDANASAAASAANTSSPSSSSSSAPRDVGTVVSPLVAVAIGGALGIY